MDPQRKRWQRDDNNDKQTGACIENESPVWYDNSIKSIKIISTLYRHSLHDTNENRCVSLYCTSTFHPSPLHVGNRFFNPYTTGVSRRVRSTTYWCGKTDFYSVLVSKCCTQDWFTPSSLSSLSYLTLENVV